MNNPLLKYQIKTVLAKEDISEGRLRLRGPQMIFVTEGRRIPVKPGWKKLWREQGRAGDIDPCGHTEITDEGESLEVDQVVAKRLVLANKCELVSGGAFCVFEGRDVPPLVELWYNRVSIYGAPHSLFQAIETVEVMTDVYSLGAGLLPRGTQFRCRSEDFFCGASPKMCTWADEPLKEGHLRLLRSSPVSREVALRQEQQSSLIRQLWERNFPGQPIGAAK